jgi:hypothetical protein
MKQNKYLCCEVMKDGNERDFRQTWRSAVASSFDVFVHPQNVRFIYQSNLVISWPKLLQCSFSHRAGVGFASAEFGLLKPECVHCSTKI